MRLNQIYLRRALVFAQRELPTSFYPENQTIVKGLSWTVLVGMAFCLDEISFRRDYKSCRIGVVVVVRRSCHIYGNFAII